MGREEAILAYLDSARQKQLRDDAEHAVRHEENTTGKERKH